MYDRAFQSLSKKQNLTKDVLVILQDPNAGHPGAAENVYPGTKNPIPAPTIADLQTVFSDVQAYFTEISNSLFTINIVAVLGPYQLKYSFSHYTTDDQNDANGDGWVSGFWQRYPEAIRSAAADFDFSRFDTNNDGILSTDELAIVIVTPGTYARGFDDRPVYTSDVNGTPLTLSFRGTNITFTTVVDMYTSTPLLTNDSRGGIAHELVHVLLGDPGDMYYDDPSFNPPDHYQPFRPLFYSLMDSDDGFCHLDPFRKLKFGWVTPKIIMTPGRYTIGTVESTHEIHILADASRGADEYFIVENRSNATQSFDRGLPDSGLAIWHIMEDPNIYGNLPAPSGVPVADWDTVPKTDWGRRAIQLIRADSTRPLDDGRALWGAPLDAAARLFWADGTPAFFLRGISSAAATVDYTMFTSSNKLSEQPAWMSLLLNDQRSNSTPARLYALLS